MANKRRDMETLTDLVLVQSATVAGSPCWRSIHTNVHSRGRVHVAWADRELIIRISEVSGGTGEGWYCRCGSGGWGLFRLRFLSTRSRRFWMWVEIAGRGMYEYISESAAWRNINGS